MAVLPKKEWILVRWEQNLAERLHNYGPWTDPEQAIAAALDLAQRYPGSHWYEVRSLHPFARIKPPAKSMVERF
jgi:hypothetical protein